jgi:cellulose biosynthesis protein BcsQ
VTSTGPARPPLTVAVAHTKGGVGKTTTTLLLGRFLAERWRVALADYDETAHLTALIADLAPAAGGGRTVTRRLWLEPAGARGGEEPDARAAELRLIDSPPSRGIRTERALAEADYVLIPAPPERMALRALRQMFATVEEVRAAGGNPLLQILGVQPTMVRRAWSEHAAYLGQLADECAARGVRVFPAVPSRQSYLWLSKAGQDYRPVADAIDRLLRLRHRGRRDRPAPPAADPGATREPRATRELLRA